MKILLVSDETDRYLWDDYQPGHLGGLDLILAAGDVKVDNRKYKEEFHEKARMIPWDSVEEAIGHAPGGVCPYAVKEGVRVFLDESLRRFDVVYPAAGNDHSAVRQTIPDLEMTSKFLRWVDVCKLR